MFYFCPKRRVFSMIEVFKFYSLQTVGHSFVQTFNQENTHSRKIYCEQTPKWTLPRDVLSGLSSDQARRRHPNDLDYSCPPDQRYLTAKTLRTLLNNRYHSLHFLTAKNHKKNHSLTKPRHDETRRRLLVRGRS